MNNSGSIITVELKKGKADDVGILLEKEGNNGSNAVISEIKPQSLAANCGLIQAGDEIIAINDVTVEDLPHEKVASILKGLPAQRDFKIRLQTLNDCIETTFAEDGTPKTVRLKKNINDNLESSDINAKSCVNGGERRESSGVKDGAQNGHCSDGQPQQKQQNKNEKLPNNTAKDVILVNGKISTQPENGCAQNGEKKAESKPNEKPIEEPVKNASVCAGPKYVRVQNLLDGTQLTDTLHQSDSALPIHCTNKRCMGSLMQAYGGFEKRPYGIPRARDEVRRQAKDFINQYFSSLKNTGSQAHLKRQDEVLQSIDRTGYYDMNQKELLFGARTAWRNASRCIGRIQWNKLQVFDARDAITPRAMFDAIVKHIKYGTNKGNLRSTMTLFPHRREPMKDYRVWNIQLIRYAGYKQADGSVIGDPANAEFTEICQQMGWKGKGGMWDILPVVCQAAGGDPELFELPKDIILEVMIKHPRMKWMEEMGMRWYALPAVSCICLDAGGLEFTACPFNGWYMGTEIGRDLGDVDRYNLLEPIAQKMGLDTKTNFSLWKDIAGVELNAAIIYSFQAANVSIVDHHTAAESFIKHFKNEYKIRGGCPGDWVWVVPPISGSLTPVFHQEMLNYSLKPSYEYQDDPWKHFQINKNSVGKRKKFSFKEVAKAVKFSASLMGKAMAKRHKVVILYATETGKSEHYAKMLGDVFSLNFDPKVMCMSEYNPLELELEELVLIVTSTFGNGDPPDNGEEFARGMYEMRHPPSNAAGVKKLQKRLSSLLMEKEKSVKVKDDSQTLANLRFSVFGLGSRAYPNFCQFAKSLDTLIQELGGEQILKMGEGDELCGQEESFKKWAKKVFKAACDIFCIGEDVNTDSATDTLSTVSSGWAEDKFRFVPDNSKTLGLCEALGQLYNKKIVLATFKSRTNLQPPESSRSTILVCLSTKDCDETAQYKAGDHVAICPANRAELVQSLIDKLMDAPEPDKPIKIESVKEASGPFGKTKKWNPIDKYPFPITLRDAFTRYLDITSTPSPQILNYLSTLATSEDEKKDLEDLGKGDNKYEDWKYDKQMNIVEIIAAYPSLKVSALFLLTQLPQLQIRYYSISSSPDVCPGEIHATVAVVKFVKQDGAGNTHHGVCSTYLNTANEGDIIPLCVRHAPSFHLPSDPTVPVIMVGPGTGIAPFRSFWQQRSYDIKHNKPTKPMDLTPCSSPELPKKRFIGGDSPDGKKSHVPLRITGSSETTPEGSPSMVRKLFKGEGTSDNWGDLWLIFGCRNSNQDDIYKQETARYKAEGALSEVWKGFSRDEHQPKRYVQDVLKENAVRVCEKLLSQKGHFYVCGDVSMAADVNRTLQALFEEYAAMSKDEAEKCVDKLKSSGRYHEDIFGVTLRTREVTDRVRVAAKRSWLYISKAGRNFMMGVTKKHQEEANGLSKLSENQQAEHSSAEEKETPEMPETETTEKSELPTEDHQNPSHEDQQNPSHEEEKEA